MAQIAQMREPHARQRVAFRRPGRGEPGKVAVGERQDHDIARRLAEIDRLDDVVEARSCGLEQMHGLSEQRLHDRLAVEALQSDHHEMALSRFRRAPGPVVIMADARADRLHQKPHRLAGDRDKTLHPQHVMRLRNAGDARRDRRGIVDLRQRHDEAVEIVVVVIELVVVMRPAVLDIVLGADA